jgi:hypothetical protein
LKEKKLDRSVLEGFDCDKNDRRARALVQASTIPAL